MSDGASPSPTNRQAIAAAGQHYRAGRIEEALETCRRALTAAPDDARLAALAGALAGELGRTGDAVDLLGRAARLSPRQGDIALNLAVALERDGDEGAALDAYRRAAEVAPGARDAWFGLARLLERRGQPADALAAYQQVLAIDPSHAGARHMASALSGENPGAPPPGFVRALFDDYASTFDASLVGRLGYRTPELLRAAVDEAAPSRRFHRVMDLGCGTGLAGAAFVDIAHRMDGVDLSPGMIDVARRRGIYAELQVGDAVGTLANGQIWDLILAADVMVYLGDLGPLFAAAAAALPPGGLFAFSVEHLPEGDYRLQPSGRYAHGESYVDDLATRHNLARLSCRRGELRLDQGRPVAGRVHVLVRP